MATNYTIYVTADLKEMGLDIYLSETIPLVGDEIGVELVGLIRIFEVKHRMFIIRSTRVVLTVEWAYDVKDPLLPVKGA